MTIGERKSNSTRIAPRHVRRFHRIGRLAMLPERLPLTILLGLLAIGFICDTLDSFGLDDASETAWSAVVSSVAGPLYGERFRDIIHRPFPARAGQANIALVLIDDRTFTENNQEGPPLSYKAQANILRKVAAAGPRAIFWDVHYPRGRLAARTAAFWDGKALGTAGSEPGIDELAATMAEIGRNRPLLIGPIGPPLLNADKSDTPDPLGALRGMLAAPTADYANGVHQVSIRTDAPGDRGYPLEPPPSGAGAGLPSTAIALYDAYCATAAKGKERVDCPNGTLPSSPRPLVLQWGLGVSKWRESQLPAKELDLCRTRTSPIENVVAYIWLGFTRALRQQRDDETIDDRTAGLHCGYHDLIYAADLNQVDVTSTSTSAPLAALLKNRMVLVGFDLPSNGDRRKVPFYGDVPGVMVHAMALDNLIESDGRPAMAPGEFFYGLNQLDFLQWVGVLLAIVMSILISRKSDLLFRTRDSLSHRRDVIAGLVCVLLILIGGIIMWYGYIVSWPLSTILVRGLLPGGIVGIALTLFSPASINRGKEHANSSEG